MVKTNLDFTEARDSEWQWHQLGRMQVCTSNQTDNHASTPLLSFLQAGCPSCCPTNSVKALKANEHSRLCVNCNYFVWSAIIGSCIWFCKVVWIYFLKYVQLLFIRMNAGSSLSAYGFISLKKSIKIYFEELSRTAVYYQLHKFF